MSDVIHDQLPVGPGFKALPAPGSRRGGDGFGGVTIRAATAEDFGWIDALQKAESDKLGFLPRMAILNRIEQGNVLVAEAAPGSRTGDGRWAAGDGGMGDGSRQSKDLAGVAGSQATPIAAGPSDGDAAPTAASPVGYCIAVDRYMQQDHVGQFIQLNVAPGSRRGFVGAALVKATFEKAAYGVKLYGLWCRQDLAANAFWQSLGFVPLAFRTAGFSKLEEIKRKTGDEAGGVHIYWQRNVRAEDDGLRSRGEFRGWWFPFETRGGLMGESRVVLPIPPGIDWRDVRPAVLPGADRRAEAARRIEAEVSEQTAETREALKRKRKEAREAGRRAAAVAAGPKEVKGVVAPKAVGGVGFGLAPEVKAQREAEAKAAAAAQEKERLKQEKREAKRAAKEARKCSDPQLLAHVREMRDRWLEWVEREPLRLEGPTPPEGSAGTAKYGVGRFLNAGNAKIAGNAGQRGLGDGEVRRLEAA